MKKYGIATKQKLTLLFKVVIMLSQYGNMIGNIQPTKKISWKGL